MSSFEETSSKVYIRSAEYEEEQVRSVIFEILGALNHARIGRGSRVLIKPNLLMAASPEKGIITHPLVVKAVVEYVLEKGGKPQISDSPATGTFERIWSHGGYKAALKGLEFEVKPFEASVLVDVGEPFGEIEIARDAMAADLVINLAKLKTHTQMSLTLGVKNIFGCIVGLRKPQWHLRAGVDKARFAQLLVRIHEAVNPGITIVDGILALEGQGPGKSGTPRHMGVIFGGDNAHAVDKTICLMLGMAPEHLPTFAQASAMGVFDGRVYINGSLRIVDDFRFPDLGPLLFGPPAIHGFLRRYLVHRPVSSDSLCKLCGECWKYCPAEAIDHHRKGIRIDYQKCIRCYCCVEVCPHAAILARQPFLGKIFNRLLRRLLGTGGDDMKTKSGHSAAGGDADHESEKCPLNRCTLENGREGGEQ